MNGTLRLGTLAGVSVLLKPSWFLVAALATAVFTPLVRNAVPDLGGFAVVAAAALWLLLTLCLLVHEVAHAVAARRYGIGVRSITLHFIGGETALDDEAATPTQELVISVVGPLASLALGGAAWALRPVAPEGVLSFTVAALALMNLTWGVFNLLPGLPFDGGRVVSAAVWRLTGQQHRGIAAAGWSGRVLAVLVLAAPLLMLQFGIQPSTLDFVLAAVYGWFLWNAATAAVTSARIRARLPQLDARRLARRTLAVPADLPLAEAVRRAQEQQAGSIVTLAPDGRPVGVVNEAAVHATPGDRRPWVPVSAVSRTLDGGLTLPADLSGERLVRAMRAAPATEYLLVEADGSVLGVLTTADVDAAFAAAR